MFDDEHGPTYVPVKRHPTRPREEPKSPWQDWRAQSATHTGASIARAPERCRARTRCARSAWPRQHDPEAGRHHANVAKAGRILEQPPASCGRSSNARPVPVKISGYHKCNGAKRETACGDEPQKCGDPPPGNTAKGTINPMSVAGSRRTKRDLAQSWQGLVKRVAERRAKERPWRNHPHRAGVNRETLTARSAWARRTVNTRRQNRRDAKVSRSQRHRPPAGREHSETPNVEAGWSEGWPPRMTQHDLQALKGTKPQERKSRIDLPHAWHCRSRSAPAVQSILTDEREEMGRRRKGRPAR